MFVMTWVPVLIGPTRGRNGVGVRNAHAVGYAFSSALRGVATGPPRPARSRPSSRSHRPYEGSQRVGRHPDRNDLHVVLIGPTRGRNIKPISGKVAPGRDVLIGPTRGRNATTSAAGRPCCRVLIGPTRGRSEFGDHIADRARTRSGSLVRLGVIAAHHLYVRVLPKINAHSAEGYVHDLPKIRTSGAPGRSG